MTATSHHGDYSGIGFDFLNGIHDSSNIVATMISSRALSPTPPWA